MAANVKSAIEGVDIQTLSEATDIEAATLSDRLSGDSPFLMSELLGVGGFCRLPPESLLRGSYA